MSEPSRLPRPFHRAHRFLDERVWHIGRDGVPVPRWKAGLARLVRICLIAGRGFVRDNCLMRAGSLTYVTIFSLVPLLAVSFAVAKGLGADKALQKQLIEPFLDQAFGQGTHGAPATPHASSEPSVALPPPAAGSEDAAPGEPAGSAVQGASPAEATGSESAEAKQLEHESAATMLRDVVDKIFQFVRETNFTSLGTFSFVFLLYCIVKLLGAIEHTLSMIWGVRTTRSFTRRLTNYLAIVVMTPMVMVTATGVTALLQGETYLAIQEHLGIDLRHVELLALLPFVVVSAGMTFLYLALPNTRVRLVSAVLGGVVGGFLWQLGQMAHVEFQLGVARMNAIYSGFAALPLFLLWLYVNWVALLLGAEVAHAHQSEPAQTSLELTPRVDQRFRERLAVRLALRIVRAFQRGEEPPDATELASDLGLPPRLAMGVLEPMVRGGILLRTDEDSGEGFVPGRDPETISLFDALVAVRHDSDGSDPPVVRHLDEGVDRALAAIEAEAARSPQNRSLATLARALDEEGGPGTTGAAGAVRPAGASSG